MPTLLRAPLLWALFALVSLGLGYAGVQRFDPRVVGNLDSGSYLGLVTGQPVHDGSVHEGRVLVPRLARPLFLALQGQTGATDAALLALLIVNAVLMAGAALLLLQVAEAATGDAGVALAAALLYLLNFAVANLHLAGLVDAAEALAVVALARALQARRWTWLPVIALLGALGKETVAPLAVLFAGGWLVCERRTTPVPGEAWAKVAAMAALSVVGVSLAQASATGTIIWPWSMASALAIGPAIGPHLLTMAGDHTTWYVFGWLLPLGLWQVRHLPAPWVIGTAVASVGVVALGLYAASPEVARPLFNVTGPLLSVAVARLLLPARAS